MFQRTSSRRRFLAGIGGGAAALGLRSIASAASAPPLAGAGSRASDLPARVAGALPSSHLAWVWQFNQDGEPERIRASLAAHGLGIALKTHDGTEWMSRYDTSRNAVSGPRRIGELANFFEAGGVPFHAWCVVQGTNPAQEAVMAHDVLSSGARSLSIDLESYPGFWQGSMNAAKLYTGLLRLTQPDATIMVTVDARPWEIDRIPLDVFAPAATALAPQVYWSDFATPPNITRYRLAGADPGAAGVTPGFALETAARKLSAFGLPMMPIGPGLIADTEAWKQFVTAAYAREMETLSVWRFGTTSPRVLEFLQANPPRLRSYVVQPGDTLSGLAASWKTTVEEIASANRLANVNMLVVGQVLTVPRGASTAMLANRTPAPAAPRATYTVQPGDSVSTLAVTWNTTSQRIVDANGLANANEIRIGQSLRIP
ncbi:MAG: LysM domain-containing protein [Dehalococcoidia bacterium]